MIKKKENQNSNKKKRSILTAENYKELLKSDDNAFEKYFQLKIQSIKKKVSNKKSGDGEDDFEEDVDDFADNLIEGEMDKIAKSKNNHDEE